MQGFRQQGHLYLRSVSQSVQSLSRVRLFAAPWTAARQASLSITNSWSLLKFLSIESVMPSHHLILCHPLLLLPSVFPSVRVFPSESVLHIRWPKYGSLIFSISPSNEYSGLISFRSDWFDLWCTLAHWVIQDRCSTATMWIGPNSYSHQQVRISGSFT